MKSERQQTFNENRGGGFLPACGWFLTGMAVGSFLTFIFDPKYGRRRRVLARDKARKLLSEGKHLSSKKARNMRNRIKGIPSKVSHSFRHNEVDDSVLVERVRSVMGRRVTHPKSVRVEATDGVVTLSGQILSREIGDLIHAIKRVPGVSRLINNLYIHESPEHVPGLQGAGKTYLQ